MFEIVFRAKKNSSQFKSEGEKVCAGKKYFKIMKNKNLNNCEKRPHFQNVAGVESKCDGGKAACKDQLNVSLLYCLKSFLTFIF